MIYFNGDIKKIVYQNHDIYSIYSCGGNLVWSGGTTPPIPSTCTAITYTATEKLNVDLRDFRPVATAETFDNGQGAVEFAENVTSISLSAFLLESGMTSVNIPDCVTIIASGAFQGCSSLPSITIPQNVTFIGPSAFNTCTSLQSITCLAVTPPTLPDANAFDNTNDCPIYVPAASVETYKTTTGWSTHASRIQPIT